LLLHTSSSHSLTPSPPPSPLYTLSLHDALPISPPPAPGRSGSCRQNGVSFPVSLTFTQAAPDTPPMSARGHRFGLLLSVTLAGIDRKSTRLNSSHEWISYAVFCLKKKKIDVYSS